MTTIAQYEALVATVEEGALAKAARKLNLTPSAVSKQLTALELELGVVLLERRPRSLQITESGQVFYQRCKEILAQIDRAEQEAQFKRGGMSGAIRLTVATALSVSVLPKLLQKFSHQHPAIRFHLRVIQPIFCASPNYLQRFGKPDKTADMDCHQLMLLSSLNLSEKLNYILVTFSRRITFIQRMISIWFSPRCGRVCVSV